jgi:hypothetical protein
VAALGATDCHFEATDLGHIMSDDARGRFRDYVELHMEPYKILPEDNERSLIGDGISKFELDGPQARGVVAVAASQSDQLLESDVSRHMLNVLHQLAGKRGRIDKRRFEKGVIILIALVKGQITEPAARVWLKRLIEDSDLTVRGRGLFRSKRWFRKIKAPK